MLFLLVVSLNAGECVSCLIIASLNVGGCVCVCKCVCVCYYFL